MFLDDALVAVSGIAVFAQALLGLLVTTRPPSEDRRIWYECAFGLIGTIGLVAIVWGGFRTVQSSSHVEQSLGRIETKDAAAADQLSRIAAALKVNPNQSAEALAEEILKRLPTGPWNLSDAQTTALGGLLDAVPTKDRFPVTCHDLPSNNQSRTFCGSLAGAFIAHGWSASTTDDFRVNPNVVGVHIAVSTRIKSVQDIPSNVQLLMKILTEAGIMQSPQFDKAWDTDPTSADVVVGAKATN